MVDLKVHKPEVSQLAVPPRLLCGPGPCNAEPRVLASMALPQVGHLDPFFLNMMEEVKSMLRYCWQTENQLTVPVSGTGTAAMEACFANLIEAGDVVLICVNGYFGLRMVDMSERYGADVRKITRPWGEVFTLDEIKAAIAEHKPRIVALVHAETSTGACQPLDGVAEAVHSAGALLLVDSVTSLGGVPILLDQWGIDAAYSGGQKCLSCPPGISPLSFGPRAMAKLTSRKTKVPNWYLDMNAVAAYLVGSGAGAARVYHHTAPISMCYAIRESLKIVVEEGLETRWDRHRQNADALWAGLEKMGLQCHVDKAHRLPSLTTVRIPAGIDGKALCTYLLSKYNIEVGGGLGELAGKVWRIGLMGYNSRPEVVMTVLAAMREGLAQQGYAFPQ
eukprot:TRINITY_DN11141_c0_g1::TRINITY_DN11141_c0_g1_i1::g.6499::m.6499 TRINITY_DN11141_c0_g1::TRINITY_DN11141_c0_g1_i1::g.6499  ORF type:complete len:417 (+),score=107.85,sp/Q54GT6/SPYA_DICDI/45.86/6e-124,Aminotran_5/PF00266.14/4.2e-43,Beta_elim_lyase/PF01212.16/0.027,Beta_elim_lyase/PF01212.16/7e+02,Aminotran_1_2/PF00155.16/0.73,Aminotran_1_2/PF00155.16/1.1e+03,Aminotran_1_2/PF00155.16/90,Cys_Met_Meta_PP/PF01053.15/0.044 TRINITY_DN11141_c0_g1_i1:80-1252(+)